MSEPITPDGNTVEAVCARVVEAMTRIRKATKFTPGDHILQITLEFEDELDLAEQWITALADCKFLLRQLGKDVS